MQGQLRLPVVPCAREHIFSWRAASSERSLRRIGGPSWKPRSSASIAWGTIKLPSARRPRRASCVESGTIRCCMRYQRSLPSSPSRQSTAQVSSRPFNKATTAGLFCWPPRDSTSSTTRGLATRCELSSTRAPKFQWSPRPWSSGFNCDDPGRPLPFTESAEPLQGQLVARFHCGLHPKSRMPPSPSPPSFCRACPCIEARRRRAATRGLIFKVCPWRTRATHRPILSNCSSVLRFVRPSWKKAFEREALTLRSPSERFLDGLSPAVLLLTYSTPHRTNAQ